MEFLYRDLTGKILDAAFKVHNYFRNGFLEKVYENALLFELKSRGVHCEQQVPLKVYYQSNTVVGEYVADLVVEDKVIIELKAVETLQKVHFAQLMNYLKTTNFKLGLIINFGQSKLEFRRVILERAR